MSEANEQRSGESNASLCSAPARKGAANDPDVQPTAGAQIAQWLREVQGAIDAREGHTLELTEVLSMARLLGTRDRLRSILDAINESA